jgi:RimJ/RimL family protein N-acetyltransferase
MYLTHIAAALANSSVRTLSQQEELQLLRDHLLRLDRTSRHDRFHGFMDDSFIERYAEKCANDGTVVIAFFENGVVRGAAELHPPDQSPDSLPEIAFSVESTVRRRGVGSILFRKLISEARAKGYKNLRITTGAQNEAMRALAAKFGAKLVFRHGESTGTIDLTRHDQTELATTWIDGAVNATRAVVGFNRAYWRMLLRISGVAPREWGAQ